MQDSIDALTRLVRTHLSPTRAPPTPTRRHAVGVFFLLVAPVLWLSLAGDAGLGAAAALLSFPLMQAFGMALLRSGGGFSHRDRVVAVGVLFAFWLTALGMLALGNVLDPPGWRGGGPVDAVGTRLVNAFLVVVAPLYVAAMAWGIWPWTGRRTRPIVAAGVLTVAALVPWWLVTGRADEPFIMLGWGLLILASAGVLLRGLVEAAPSEGAAGGAG